MKQDDIVQREYDNRPSPPTIMVEPSRLAFFRCISEILDQNSSVHEGTSLSLPRIVTETGDEKESTHQTFQKSACEEEEEDGIKVISSSDDDKSTLCLELKAELFSDPKKSGAVLFFFLFVIASLIFCATALKFGLKRNATMSDVVPPLGMANTSPTMAPSPNSNLRNTAPSMAPSRSMQLFSPTLYAPILDPTGCIKQPTPRSLAGKKGVAFTLRPEGQKGSWVENLPKVKALNAYWNYSWGASRIDAQPIGMEFTPMIWGPWDVPTFLQDDIVPQIQDKLAHRILGFNEPDKEKQANMSVDQALEFWPLLQDTGLSLVSPSCADPMGTWMEEFMEKATELCYRVDWIGVHWYGGPNVNKFQTRMTEIYEKYGKPILITEFAPADWAATTVQSNRHSSQDVLNFAKAALPWLEAQPWVAGYAWYSFNIAQPVGTSSALFDIDGSLTPLGQYYASVRTK